MKDCKRSPAGGPVRVLGARRIRRKVAVLTLAALLTACAAPTLRTDVVAFHDWPAEARRGYRLNLTAAQQASLEQSAYAQALQGELAAAGFASAADARFVVTFDTSVRQRIERVYDPTPPFYGSYWYGGPGRGALMMGMPIGGWGYPPREVLRFDRELKLIIEDAQARPPRRVYEATAFSSGPQAAMVPMFTLMARALLQQFPGPSGATRHIEVVIPQTKP